MLMTLACCSSYGVQQDSRIKKRVPKNMSVRVELGTLDIWPILLVRF